MITWRTSSFSGNAGGQNCVEVGQRVEDSGIAVRDTKDRDGATFTFTPNNWAGFVANLKSGTFDPA